MDDTAIKILRDLVALQVYDDEYGYCFCCSNNKGRPHQADCVYERAVALLATLPPGGDPA